MWDDDRIAELSTCERERNASIVIWDDEWKPISDVNAWKLNGIFGLNVAV